LGAEIGAAMLRELVLLDNQSQGISSPWILRISSLLQSSKVALAGRLPKSTKICGCRCPSSFKMQDICTAHINDKTGRLSGATTQRKRSTMGAQWKAKGKALVADAKGKLFGKLVKEITVAARGGADPATNSRLRLVVEQARKASMPKDTLERAIKKGSGTGADAVNYERVIYEGFAPHQVAVMVECLTDNVNRTAPEMRVLFRKGQLGTSGSVAWDFNHVGMIEAEPARPDADPELAAIEAGAQDFEAGDEEGVTMFWTDPTDLDLVSRALPAQGFTVLSAKLGYKPKNPVNPANLTAEQLEEVESFLAAIDANDDVQNVFVSLAG
jgi:YebC/PmpR family DNA-binding regulatory protein